MPGPCIVDMMVASINGNAVLCARRSERWSEKESWSKHSADPVGRSISELQGHSKVNVPWLRAICGVGIFTMETDMSVILYVFVFGGVVALTGTNGGGSPFQPYFLSAVKAWRQFRVRSGVKETSSRRAGGLDREAGGVWELSWR